MTKRDIADIALVWMALSFLMWLLNSVTGLGLFISMYESDDFFGKPVRVTFQLLQVIGVLLVIYVLLFKRSLLLSRIFPDGNDKEVTVPPGLSVLTSYAFWIRLFGIFSFLSSTIMLIGRLGADLALRRELLSQQFWMYDTGAEVGAAVLAAIVIWKADWIAERLGRIGLSNKRDEANAQEHVAHR